MQVKIVPGFTMSNIEFRWKSLICSWSFAGPGTVKWLRVRQPYSDFFDTHHTSGLEKIVRCAVMSCERGQQKWTWVKWSVKLKCDGVRKIPCSSGRLPWRHPRRRPGQGQGALKLHLSAVHAANSTMSVVDLYTKVNEPPQPVRFLSSSWCPFKILQGNVTLICRISL